MARRGVLERELAQRRSPEELRRFKRRRLMDALSSLWAPPSCFLAAFTLYAEVLPFFSQTWRAPRLVLLAVVPPTSRRRGLRLRAVELLDDLHPAVRRRKDLSPTTLSELAEVARRLENAWADGDEGALSRELERTGRALDEKLPKWRRSDVWSFLGGLVKALVVVGVLRLAVVEPFAIPSGSMLPTLQVGDYVLVNKFLFGVQLPLQKRVPFVLVRPPARGDVVVFDNPLDDSVNLVKRVVGVPGDRVELRDEVLYVNGVKAPRELLAASYVAQDRVGGRWFPRETVLYAEALSRTPHLVLQYPSHPDAKQLLGPWIVPEGHVFVMGDNRDGSEDSRAGFGLSPKAEFVPTGHIKGKVWLVFASFGPGGALGRLFGGIGLRLERLFVPVQ